MSNTSLIVSLQNPAEGALADYWVELEQVLPKDGMTTTEAGQLIDQIFGIEPCQTAYDEDEIKVQETDQISKEEFLALIRDALSCGKFNNEWTAVLRARVSDWGIPYKLVVDRGTPGPAAHHEAKTSELFEVTKASSLTIRGRIVDVKGDYKPSVRWTTATVVSKAGYIKAPSLAVSEHSITWETEVTGVLEVVYIDEYDEIVVVIDEDDIESKKREHINGPPEEPSDTPPFDEPTTLQRSSTGEGVVQTDVKPKARCFYHYLMADIELTNPDAKFNLDAKDQYSYCGESVSDFVDSDENFPCYQRYWTAEYCGCKGEYKNGWWTTNEVSCSEGMEPYSYFPEGEEIRRTVACGDTDMFNDWDFYFEKCCHLPYVGLPQCAVMEYYYEGTEVLDQETKDFYSYVYRTTGVNFVPVGTGANYCGKVVTRQQLGLTDCCEGVPELEIVEDMTIDSIGLNDSGPIVVTAGRGPYEWSTRSKGAFFDSQHKYKTLTTEGPGVNLYTTGDACGTIVITVQDSCSSATKKVLTDNGHWEDVSHTYNKRCGLSGYIVEEGVDSVLHDGTTLSGEWAITKQVEDIKQYELADYSRHDSGAGLVNTEVRFAPTDEEDPDHCGAGGCCNSSGCCIGIDEIAAAGGVWEARLDYGCPGLFKFPDDLCMRFPEHPFRDLYGDANFPTNCSGMSVDQILRIKWNGGLPCGVCYNWECTSSGWGLVTDSMLYYRLYSYVSPEEAITRRKVWRWVCDE